jgi:hypothetical protein
MKRMNRKKIIIELECLRGAIANSIMNAKIEEKEWKVMAYKAHYDRADNLIVELGGESCLYTQNEIMKAWSELDKNKLEDIKKYVSDQVGYTIIDSEYKQYGANDDEIIEMIFKKFILKE